MATGNERQAAGQKANPHRLGRRLRLRANCVFRLLCLLPVACCWSVVQAAEPEALGFPRDRQAGKADPQTDAAIRWRFDYPNARQEARNTGRPLMLYFAAGSSAPCQKMEVTTLQDPGLIRFLNQQFIPIKLDEQREQRLLERLKIQEFPTIILAGPDGKIYDTLPSGYMEATPLRERLQKVVALLVNPEWMVKDHQEAVHAAANADYARAVKLLRPIAEDKQVRAIQVEAQKALGEIEAKAQKALATARQLEAEGQLLEAAEAYEEAARAFAGTPAAAEADQAAVDLNEKPDVKLRLRKRRAASLLEQARSEFRRQQWLCCVDRCTTLTSGYADLPECAEASQLLDQIKANPDWMKVLTDNLADRLAEMYLASAETWIHKGEPQLAAPYLEKVIVAFPGSRHAEIAKARLAQIQVRPLNPLKFLRSKFQGSSKDVEVKP